MGSATISEEKPKGWMGRNWVILVGVLLITVWFGTPLWIRLWMGPVEGSPLSSAGQFGDQFGAINALFTALTVLLVFIAFQEEKIDRKQAEERWRKERADGEAARKQSEVDRRVRYFLGAMERFQHERSRLRVPTTKTNKVISDDGTVVPIETPVTRSGRMAILALLEFLDARLDEDPSCLTEDNSRQRDAFCGRVSRWYDDMARDYLGPMLAHIATLHWALSFVAQNDPDAASMLKVALRRALTFDDFKLIFSVAFADSEMRSFVLAVYDRENCEIPFGYHQMDWLWDTHVSPMPSTDTSQSAVGVGRLRSCE